MTYFIKRIAVINMRAREHLAQNTKNKTRRKRKTTKEAPRRRTNSYWTQSAKQRKPATTYKRPSSRTLDASWATVLDAPSKTRALRSFQISQTIRTTESKPFRWSMKIFFLRRSHQSARAPSWAGVKNWNPTLRSWTDQSSLLKTQVRSRCSIDSGAWSHRAHELSLRRPCFCILSEVQQRDSKAVQTKNLQVGGARVLDNSFAPSKTHCPIRNARYAEDAENCWSAVHFQINLSWAV
jgi:hypothetical protein